LFNAILNLKIKNKIIEKNYRIIKKKRIII